MTELTLIEIYKNILNMGISVVILGMVSFLAFKYIPKYMDLSVLRQSKQDELMTKIVACSERSALALEQNTAAFDRNSRAFDKVDTVLTTSMAATENLLRDLKIDVARIGEHVDFNKQTLGILADRKAV